jgi:hypothetical protein
MKRTAICRPLFLLELCVFRFGSEQNGDVGVGVFPKREKILVGGAGLGLVAGQRIGAGQPNIRERRKRIGHTHPRARERYAGRCLVASAAKLPTAASVRPRKAVAPAALSLKLLLWKMRTACAENCSAFLNLPSQAALPTTSNPMSPAPNKLPEAH